VVLLMNSHVIIYLLLLKKTKVNTYLFFLRWSMCLVISSFYSSELYRTTKSWFSRFVSDEGDGSLSSSSRLVVD
jgi:hypothetical protein